jgi:hypothetical protein
MINSSLSIGGTENVRPIREQSSYPHQLISNLEAESNRKYGAERVLFQLKSRLFVPKFLLFLP